jgi:hypothetical protein
VGRVPLFALVTAVLLVGCGRQSSQDVAEEDVQPPMEPQVGQKLNASSPLSMADVEGKLRVGMPFNELNQFISKDNKGPNEYTKVRGGVYMVGDPPRPDPRKESRTYFLRDTTLHVIIEYVGTEDEGEDQVVSWRAEPMRGD